MCFANRWAAALLVLGLLAAAWCCAVVPAPTATPLPSGLGPVVHEWGTFSTFSGSDGKNLKFEPYDNDLPDFVHGYLPKYSKAGPAGGTISLETPVLYFYSREPLTASVQVDFPRGILTEWYPRAARTDSRLVWRGVKVLPGEALRLPSEAKASRYYAARETEAAPLRVASPPDRDKGGTEQEKFLFYRGVGTFAMPLSMRADDDGKFTVGWSGEDLPAELILVQVQAGKVRFQPFHLDRRSKGPARADVQVPSGDSTVGELGEALVKLLTGQGLFEKEARAMVKTWSSAWFGEEGTRVLYVLPGKLTADLLPLRVEPKPTTLVRVLVGRHDVLTPERERQIDSWVARVGRSAPGEEAEKRSASKELAKLGRYRDAAWREAEGRLKTRR